MQVLMERVYRLIKELLMSIGFQIDEGMGLFNVYRHYGFRKDIWCNKLKCMLGMLNYIMVFSIWMLLAM